MNSRWYFRGYSCSGALILLLKQLKHAGAGTQDLMNGNWRLVCGVTLTVTMWRKGV